jgi:(R,R)-butanediol dehydrogenase/meso-butanediol dehydrogenase/diacetyl reductase
VTAAYYTGQGQLEFRPCEPRPPAASEVCIDVAYAGVCGSDLSIYHGHRDERMSLPTVIGHEMSGVIAEVGADVGNWQPGDRVAVLPFETCGSCRACKRGHSNICYNMNFFGVESAGAFQDCWTVPAHTLHRLPQDISLEHAALVEPVSVAMHAVRTSGLKQGDFAVVLGGGPIGLLTALVAKYRGGRILLSELNPFRVDFARGMGLEVVDPAADDLQEAVRQATDGSGADMVFEVSGSQAAATAMSELLCARGLMLVVAVFGEPPRINLKSCFMRELRLQAVRCYNHEDFDDAIDLIASGQYPFERVITGQVQVEELAGVFHEMETAAPVMKTLLKIGGPG